MLRRAGQLLGAFRPNIVRHVSRPTSLSSTQRRLLNHTMPGAPFRKKVTCCLIPRVELGCASQVTTLELQKMRNEGKPISMVTAYTFPSAVHVDAAGIDILLVLFERQ